MKVKALIYCLLGCMLFAGISKSFGQTIKRGPNDTILLGAVVYKGDTIGLIFLPEFVLIGKTSDKYLADLKKEEKLRNDVYAAYPYAVVAGEVFKEVRAKLDKMPERRDRKKYLKSTEKRLDDVFKEPLKNLSIDQGHLLVKLIDRQTGQSCYDLIKEFKNGISAMVWSGVGVVFGNNLSRPYDPTGDDKDIEKIVRELETSNAYRYQVYEQQLRLRMAKVPANTQAKGN